jgi:hypothetical protein
MRVPFEEPLPRVATDLVEVSLVAAPRSLVAAVDPLILPISGVALLIIVLVVWPAVWSRKKARREAALEVLDRIFGRKSEQK